VFGAHTDKPAKSRRDVAHATEAFRLIVPASAGLPSISFDVDAWLAAEPEVERDTLPLVIELCDDRITAFEQRLDELHPTST
jgi:hypothetical protein